MKNNKNFGLSPDLLDAVRNVLAGKPKEESVEEGGPYPYSARPGARKTAALAKKPAVPMAKWIDGSGKKSNPKPVKEDDELDDVDPKAVRKKFKDRKDKGIDNDGDTDDSDKFIHKKRKAISKAIAKDDEVKTEEIKKGSYVTNKKGHVGKVHGVSGDKSSVDIKWNKGGGSSLPIKHVTKIKEDDDKLERNTIVLDEFTKKDFRSNEDNNMHTENAVELARKFGTTSEYNKMVAIYKSHRNRGHISSSEQKQRDALVKKYISKLTEDVEVAKGKARVESFSAFSDRSIVDFVLEEGEEVDLDEGTIDKVKDIASKKQAMKIDGVMVDSFTASAISQIYDKVNDANKKKMDSLPITKLADMAFKMMQKNEFVPEEVDLDEAKYTYKAATFNGNTVVGTGSTEEAAIKDAKNKAKELGSTLRKRISMKKEEVEIDEATTQRNVGVTTSRQLKDKKKEMMVHHPRTGVKVIDKKDWNIHKAGGYTQAEEKGKKGKKDIIDMEPSIDETN